MIEKLRRTLALAALMTGAAALSDKAEATEGWYGRIDAGWTVGGDIDGVTIRSEAHGETDLAQATRDGVREPLNRRTAVIITFR